MVTGQDKPAEMIGSNERVVDLSGGNVDTHVRLAPTGMEAVASSRELSFGDARIEPDRVFLKLENVRGGNDAAVFYVYVGLPEGADPAQHPISGQPPIPGQHPITANHHLRIIPGTGRSS